MNLISSRELAMRAGVSMSYIRNLRRIGVIEFKKIGRDFFFSENVLQLLQEIEREKKRGRSRSGFKGG